MNKKLVAAALGLAFAAPVFADSSNVTLYGRIHQALDHQSSDTAGAESGGNFAIEDVSSRLGVRGTEDLGGGLSAIFAYEFGVNTDEVSAAPMSTRHAYLGLKGAYGLAVIGSQDGGNDSQAPLYNQASLIGSVSNNGGPLTTVGSTNVGLGQAITREQRVGNSFGYAGNFGGVQINARHALGNGTNDQANNTATGLKENDTRSTEIAATYKIGALTFGGGFQSIDSQEVTQNTLNATAGVEQVIQGVVSYNFGSFTVGGLIAQKNLYSAATNGEDSNTEYALTASVPLTGNSGIFGMYADSERNDSLTSTTVGGVTTVTNTPRDVTQAQIAYYYDFSKRTRTYVGYNRLNAEVKASGVETDTDNFTIGLRHNF
ncbi:Outer membrane protein (Porin) [Limnobacter sp. 130]|uniref:porin n=1 Tax=Limnobacter sp. 130 TaxID=2653147 RepID=UPI0012F2A858|nr:porin [Limnobacter sp. 130]VWX34278.1 Outer membrane protein (Porin) [Limnobacter sp. 130]